MSRSGVPPKAEVTKSLWSTDPASTKATTPGVSDAGRPLTVGYPVGLDLGSDRFVVRARVEVE